jgi:tRNA(Ile)-lysidine synthase
VLAAELADLFGAALSASDRIGLAVSGGSDSTALMVLFADWLAQGALRRLPCTPTVLTVDHRLRPQSEREARAVARRAAELGFCHVTLVWEEQKPATGLQAAARSARYRLLADYAGRHGITALLTGHTADDQAETLLMRLARGSGLDGLAAMAPESTHFIQRLAVQAAPATPPSPGKAAQRASLRLVRPLLGLSRARLRATLDARGIAWFEDPSNQSPVFERTRVRTSLRALEAVGLTQDKLALSARRLQRARAALECSVEEFCDPRRHVLTSDPCGFIRIDAEALRRAPLEITIRLLGRAVAAAGGAGLPVPLAKLEALADALRRRGLGHWTLARAKITATCGQILIAREPGRIPPPRLLLARGAHALWDGRFLVSAGNDLTGDIEVRALGAAGLREAARCVAISPDAPRGALWALPSFWREGRLIAVPNLGYWAPGEPRPSLSAIFWPTCSCKA